MVCRQEVKGRCPPNHSQTLYSQIPYCEYIKNALVSALSTVNQKYTPSGSTHSVTFSQHSSSPHLIEDETFNDSGIINNLVDYEDGQEEPDSSIADKSYTICDFRLLHSKLGLMNITNTYFDKTSF
ncbi:UNVERIFIED_CONTAM: hypothetical protein NCL1_02674 [Trichonephila clavipes]